MVKKNNVTRRKALEDQALREGLNAKNTKLKVIYPQSFVEKIKKISHKKIYDFSFVGSLDWSRPKLHKKGSRNRRWIISFDKENFGKNSIFINTSKDLNQNKKWSALGDFDKTFSKEKNMPLQVFAKGSPQEKTKDTALFDENYYTIMCQSKFTLCPAGDAMWSMRFFEAMMCKSIPVVKKPQEAWRLKEEEQAGYIYYLADELKEYSREVVNHNYKLFLKHHTFLQT